MVEHELKCFPDYWDAVQRGEKNFEVRRDDRGFQKGDKLKLIRLRFDSLALGSKYVEDRDYSNSRRILERKIIYILTGGQFGIEPGYVVLGLKK